MFVRKSAVGFGTRTEQFKLYIVLHAPKFSQDLLLISQLCDAGFKVKFDANKVIV